MSLAERIDRWLGLNPEAARDGRARLGWSDALAALNGRAMAVWRRQVLVWRKLFWSSMASNVANPLLFLFGFGFGIGAVVERMEGLDYLSFIVPGMMAYSAMFAASFEASISVYARYKMQRTWDGVLATPVTLAELMGGELAWCVTKAMIASFCVCLVGALWGGIGSIAGSIAALLLTLFASIAFAAVGLCATSCAKGWEFFNYFFTFWITPNFMFSGVFFELDRLPWLIQKIAWLLPMTHLIAAIRPLTSGMGIEPFALLGHALYLALLAAAAFWYAHRNFAARLFD